MKSKIREKQILESAKKVFARHGYQKANITMICKKAGIGRGTFYLYFKNKEAVFAAILENIFVKTTREMDQGAATVKTSYASEEELFEDHAQTLERGFMVWLADRDFARIAFEMSLGVSKEFTEKRLEFDRNNISLMKKRLDLKKRSGFLREDLDTELAAIKIHGGMEKIITTYLIDRKEKLTPKAVRALMRKVAKLNLQGMFKQPGK